MLPCKITSVYLGAAKTNLLLILGLAATVFAIGGCRGLSGAVPTNISGGANSSVTQRFGMHMHDAIHYWPSVTFGYWRVWDAGVSWPQVETARGVYDFSVLDQYVALAEQHNVQIIYCLGNTP